MASCKKHDLNEGQTSKRHFDIEKRLETSRLTFNSPEMLQNCIESIKQTDDFELPKTLFAATKSILSQNFVSLRQSLIDQGLKNFTDAELQQIVNEDVTYEPDDYIVDPYMQSVLNDKREIEVNGKIYKYIPEGVLICDSENYDGLNDVFSNDDIIFNGYGTYANGVGFRSIQYRNTSTIGIPSDQIDPNERYADNGSTGGN